MKLAMNESTKVSAVAYANRTWYRREVVYIRENILDAMPIGVPMTAKEICDKVAELGVAGLWGRSALKINPQSVYQCYKSLEPYGVMKREVVKLDTPYQIEVESEYHDDYKNCWATKKKIITIDTVTKYVRVV